MAAAPASARPRLGDRKEGEGERGERVPAALLPKPTAPLGERPRGPTGSRSIACVAMAVAGRDLGLTSLPRTEEPKAGPGADRGERARLFVTTAVPLGDAAGAARGDVARGLLRCAGDGATGEDACRRLLPGVRLPGVEPLRARRSSRFSLSRASSLARTASIRNKDRETDSYLKDAQELLRPQCSCATKLR